MSKNVMREKITFKRKVLACLFSALFLFCLFNLQQAAFANGVQPLVETGWLADNLKNPGLAIVYVGGPASQKANFDAKHIPGSVYLDFGKLLSSLGDGSAPPDKANFEALANSFGIGNDTHVVLHSGSDSLAASGAFWLFDYFGHKKLSILNGGIEKWMKEGRAATGEPAKISPAAYKANADASVLANADYVLKNLKNPKAAIVDTRGADEYTGKNLMGNKTGGHIPGAVDLGFYASNLNSDGTFKSAKDLKAVYEAGGVTKDKEAITYCQAGIRSAHSYFALKYILGYPKVRNYVGAWREWGNRLDTAKYPIEK